MTTKLPEGWRIVTGGPQRPLGVMPSVWEALTDHERDCASRLATEDAVAQNGFQARLACWPESYTRQQREEARRIGRAILDPRCKPGGGVR